MILALWRLALRIIGPILAWRLVVRRRAQGVGEERLDELRGLTLRPRPDGPLVWLHAASVGESLSLLPLIEALHRARPDLSCLVTTVTPTSAQVMAERLPQGAFHQFAPVDVPRYLRRFLLHWQPDLLVVVESEIWPLMLDSVDRARIPRALVNARLSERSLARWAYAPGLARAMFLPFRLVTAQSAPVAEALSALGAHDVRVIGNLKATGHAPPADPAELARLRDLIDKRPVWAAVSTHEGEEALALAAHDAVRATLPDALLILCPRHPERAGAVSGLATMTRRSRGEGPEGPVWLVDTLGETGLWYRLAPVTFLGGSLVPAGGHNPWEAALSGTALLHGPLVVNAQGAWDALDAAAGARAVDAGSLGGAVASLLSDPQEARDMAASGKALALAQDRPAEEIAAALLTLMTTGRG